MVSWKQTSIQNGMHHVFFVLNKSLIRKPVHLPLIDSIIWKIQSFTYATCLDMNRVYARLPQGCMLSSDVFQAHISKTFYDFNDVIVYIDNIILFTKQSFQHHVNRLSLVLERIRSQNWHVHIEETFLACQEVDYLGYTLSSKGIKPQNKKIIAILALDEPKNKKQLRSFLGFVNFYRQLWYHMSHVITPLTAIVSEKAKWAWGPD